MNLDVLARGRAAAVEQLPLGGNILGAPRSHAARGDPYCYLIPETPSPALYSIQCSNEISRKLVHLLVVPSIVPDELG